MLLLSKFTMYNTVLKSAKSNDKNKIILVQVLTKI